MSKTTCVMTFILLALTIGPAFTEEKVESQQNEIILAGKLFCSVKRRVVIPFHCVITSINAHSGQKVKAGDVLARFRLALEEDLRLRQRVSSSAVQELEIKLDENNNALELQLDKKRDIQQLSAHDMAASDSMEETEREIGLLKKKNEYLQERLSVERALAEEDLAVVEYLLGNTVRHGHNPQDGAFKAPIDSHVIWVHPDLQKDAEFWEGTAVFSMGVMDPMLIRAHVHEIEALQLKVGEVANFTTESIPGRKFTARVSRISWETLTTQLDSPSYYEVEFEVANPDVILKDGLRGRITLGNS